MGILDLRTIIFSQMATEAICTLVIAFLWWQYRKHYRGLACWLAFYVLHWAAMILIGLRGQIPDWISIVLANTLVMTGMFLGYVGLERFFEKPSRQWHNYTLLVVFVLVHTHFTLVQPNLTVRLFNVSAVFLMFSLQSLWLISRRVAPDFRRFARGWTLFFSVLCLANVARMFLLLAHPLHTNDLFQSGLSGSLIMMSYDAVLILLAFCLFMMVNGRLRVELLSQKEKYAKTFYSSPYAVTLSRLKDGQFLEANEGFLKITGYQRSEVVGKTSFDLNLWASVEDRATLVSELLQGRPVREREFAFHNKAGELFTGQCSAERLVIQGESWVLCTINDITERKRAEEALRRSEALYRAIGESIDYGVWVCGPDGRNIYASESFLKLVGLTQEQCSNFGWGDVLHPDDAERTIASWRECVQNGGRAWDNEQRFRGVDGQWHDILARGVPVRDGRGDVLCWAGINLDIKQLKRAEEALREAHDQLELRVRQRTADLAAANGKIHALAARLSELDESERRLLARELHDQIGQALTALGINLHYVQQQLAPETPRRILERLDDALEQLEQLTGRVRNLMSELRPAVLDDYGLPAALHWYGEQFSKRTGIPVDLDDDDMAGRLPLAIETALFRIAQEALTNIVKYARASRVDLILEEAGDTVRLTIADDGVGFDPAIKSAPQEQTGWGQLIMRERAAAVGGNITVESEPGNGTRVVVEVGR